MASIFEGEGPGYPMTSESDYNNSSGVRQRGGTYAMCSVCYTQHDCVHSNISQHQDGLSMDAYCMKLAPFVYLEHDPPLSSLGGFNEYSRGQQPNSLPSISSPSWFNGVNKLVSAASLTASAGQHAPYPEELSGLPGLEMLSMTSSGDGLFSQDVHGLPDLTHEPVATVSPRALERYPAADYMQLQAEAQLQREQSPSALSSSSSSSSSHGDDDEEEEDMDDDNDNDNDTGLEADNDNDDDYDGEDEMPLMLTRPPKQPSCPAQYSKPLRFTSETLYHEALYGAGKPADPDSSRAKLNKQVLPIVAAKHGHPVWPLDTKEKKYTYLLEAKKLGVSYRDIKMFGEIPDAESTLRGRYRMLTKSADERVRRPVWEPQDIHLLRIAVQKYGDGRQPRRHRDIGRVSISSNEDTTELRISWKRVAEYIARNGGSYKFGYSTCRKKWDQLNEQF